MPETGERGYAEWDRERGWSNGEDDDTSGSVNIRKVDIKDLDVNIPVSKIDDGDDEPDEDIDIDRSDLNIVPVTPNIDRQDDEAVIIDSIIRDGILDESKNATSKKTKDSEIN